MSDVNGLTGLSLIRLNGDDARALPPEIRHAADLLGAYVSGLTEGRRFAFAGIARPAFLDNPAPRTVVAAAPAEAADHDAVPAEATDHEAAPPEAANQEPVPADEGLAARALAERRASAVNDAALSDRFSGVAAACGPIMEAAQGRAGMAMTEGEGPVDVVVVWGPDAYDKVRRALR